MIAKSVIASEQRRIHPTEDSASAGTALCR
jgi:hypothetical protein